MRTQAGHEASRSRLSRAIDISCGRPPRYALTCRYGRPGKPTSQSKAGRGPAKRDLYTIVTSLYDAPDIWLAFKRTTFNVCAFCMAARTVAAFAQPSVLSPASLHGCAHGRRFCSALSPQSSVLLLRMAARTVAALSMSDAFFSSRVLYKFILRGFECKAKLTGTIPLKKWISIL